MSNKDKVRKVKLVIEEKVIKVAPDNPLHPGGIKYNGTAVNGTVPGPVIGITVGDVLEITLENRTKLIQSLCVNAGYGPSQALSGNVLPGESKTWRLKGHTPGAFLYYSTGDGLNGIWEHIANGVFGAIIVHSYFQVPKAKEFCMIFSEIYNTEDKGIFVGTGGKIGSFDMGKLYYGRSDLCLTNGMAHKYLPGIGAMNTIKFNDDAEVFMVKPGELTRWYILNAGPNDHVAFSFIGNISNVKFEPSKDNFQLYHNEARAWTIPPGSGQVIETTFPEEGVYVGLDHSMTRFMKGAGFAIVATNAAEPDDHPEGSSIPG